MKKFSLILTGMFAVTSLIVSCNKIDNGGNGSGSNGNGCPVGYTGLDCSVSWVNYISGVWHSTITVPPPDNNSVMIIQALDTTGDPTHFQMITFIENDLNGAFYHLNVPVSGTMGDTSSFTLNQTLITDSGIQGEKIYLLQGTGTISSDGQTISGTRSYMLLTPNVNSTYDTTYTTKDFALIR